MYGYLSQFQTSSNSENSFPKLCFVVQSVVAPDDDGDDVVEAAVLAAVGAGGAAQATNMAAPTIAKSGMMTETVILLLHSQNCYHKIAITKLLSQY